MLNSSNLIFPDWPAPANVKSLQTTRTGGVSQAPYHSLNLGDHVGDEANAVATNRKIFSDAVGARPVFLKQVHGRNVMWLTADTPDDCSADGAFATTRGVACTMMVADCLPVLLTTTDARVVGAAHAGWRGLAGTDGRGILESVCEAMFTETGAKPADTLAWLGPCIGPDAFEVGPEVRAAFDADDAAASALFTPHGQGKYLADLAGLARMRLQALGITQVFGNDSTREWCTVSNASRFFSHRRDRVSGRFAAAIWLG